MANLAISNAARDLFRDKSGVEYIVYHFPNKGAFLDVDRCSRNADHASSSRIEALVTSLPEDECRYVIYNFRFLTAEGGDMHKMVLIIWCPYDAAGPDRELYTANRSAVRRQMTGIAFEIFVQAPEDLGFGEIKRLVDG